LDSLRNKFKTLKNHKKPTGKITKWSSWQILLSVAHYFSFYSLISF
jgi:hypothetical protein